MNRQGLTLVIGAAAGGLLGAAALPAAVAVADDYTIAPVDTSPETVTGVYNLDTAPPAVNASLQGQQTFELFDTTSHSSIGDFAGDESNSSDILGGTNELVLVTSPNDGPVGDVAPVGSVFDYYQLGDSGYANIYSDLASATPGGDVVSDTVVTPYGDATFPLTFDAADGLNKLLTDLPGPSSTVVSGLSPFDLAVQYQQPGEVDTTTSDIFGNSTEETFVTGAGSDLGPAGSVFNTINFVEGFQDSYSAIPLANGDVVTDTVTTPFGVFDLPVTFDAAAVANANASIIPVFGGYDLAVASPEVFTGVNGVPPLDVALQGTQTFNVEGLTGTAQQITADVSTSSDGLLGATDEAIYVTHGADLAGVPQAGSVFDIYNIGGSDVTSVYSDIVSSTGTNAISETLVTPLGDITIPLLEALPSFGIDSFLPIPF